ncbi:hypothetical protein [Mycobacterium lepromatosis]|uniref:hypothetical protein n=1 Tax=Mycobacterium lepromatosis TaxID=480418 RepID=UPI0009E589E6|nr:hypothetical protein [Mycobacterium lepromatosis]
MLFVDVTASSPVCRALGPLVRDYLAMVVWWVLRRSTEVPPLAQTIARSDRIPVVLENIAARCCKCYWLALGHP